MTHRAQTSAFPAGFLWGAATSAYQIEGATTEDGRGPSIWDQFAASPGRTYGGETGERAVDHYHRMASDVALMDDLGLSAYRFSIAWPRVLPEGTGAVNAAGLDFYDRLVDSLLERGITPVATLYHWDLPLGLYERGGWRARETAYAFADYAEVVARRLGDRVGWWVTQNEPWCSAYLGYGAGLHAPGVREDAQGMVDVGHHLLLSHGLAIPRLRAGSAAGARVGAALNLFPVFAGEPGSASVEAVERADRFHNRWFLDPLYRGEYPPHLFEQLGAAPPPIQDGDMGVIRTPTDFLGVNYYNRIVVRGSMRDALAWSATGANGVDGATGATGVAAASNGRGAAVAVDYITDLPGAERTAKGWEVYPHGLTLVLEELHRAYHPPALLITENGAAFDDVVDESGHVSDPARVAFLRQHVEAVATAVGHGVPVAGYLVWSLFDNFEWEDGYSKRFGLIYVDYATQRRIIKDSGRWYAGLIADQRALRVG